jgi:hypothetical protein
MNITCIFRKIYQTIGQISYGLCPSTPISWMENPKPPVRALLITPSYATGDCETMYIEYLHNRNNQRNNDVYTQSNQKYFSLSRIIKLVYNCFPWKLNVRVTLSAQFSKYNRYSDTNFLFTSSNVSQRWMGVTWSNIIPPWLWCQK